MSEEKQKLKFNSKTHTIFNLVLTQNLGKRSISCERDLISSDIKFGDDITSKNSKNHFTSTICETEYNLGRNTLLIIWKDVNGLHIFLDQKKILNTRDFEYIREQRPLVWPRFFHSLVRRLLVHAKMVQHTLICLEHFKLVYFWNYSFEFQEIRFNCPW